MIEMDKKLLLAIVLMLNGALGLFIGYTVGTIIIKVLAMFGIVI